MLAVALLVITAALLVAEPDLGQTILFVAVWGALFFLAGANTLIFAGLGGVARRRACSPPTTCSRTSPDASTASSIRRAATISRS